MQTLTACTSGAADLRRMFARYQQVRTREARALQVSATLTKRLQVIRFGVHHLITQPAGPVAPTDPASEGVRPIAVLSILAGRQACWQTDCEQ